MTEPLYFPGALDQVYQMDALELLKVLPPESVNAFILDLPYGTTACSWDEIIPFEPMWAGVKRVLKPRGVFVTTASQPFTSKLVMSNLDWFKYEWIWEKAIATQFLDANRKPMKKHENVLVFYSEPPLYNPQFTYGVPYTTNPKSPPTSIYNNHIRVATTNNGSRYPVSVIRFDNERGHHPTQKPVALFRYLIRTYTQLGDLVVDFCCGSGTTALAAREEGRRFIVGDTSPEYVAIARERLAQPHTLSFMNILDSVAKDSAACPNLSNSKVIPK